MVYEPEQITGVIRNKVAENREEEDTFTYKHCLESLGSKDPLIEGFLSQNVDALSPKVF